MADDSTSDFYDSFAEGQCRVNQSRSLRFHQSMSLFLSPEIFDKTCALPKVRWSIYDDNSNALEALTGRNWTLFKVSPMYNFSYSDLKKYCAFIKKAIEQKNIFNNNSYNVKVTFEVIDEFSSSENDEPGVQINVENNVGGRTKILYKGYLISWKNKRSGDTSKVKLPVLLCSFVDQFIVKTVHSTLQRVFDTLILPIYFPQDDFVCFSALIIRFLEEDVSKEVLFTYVSPGKRNVTSLKIQLPLAKIIDLWNRIDDNDDGSSVPVKKLIKYQFSLETHMEHAYGVCLEDLFFMSMVVPNQVSLHYKGKVKFSSPKVFNALLNYLTNKT